jgi:four helix bundle protein
LRVARIKIKAWGTRHKTHDTRGEMEKSYKKLIIWKKADELAHQIYLQTKRFPKDEIYGITSQLRRAAISVPTNIVEGAGRQNKNERKQFANIALGSLAETEYLLEFCHRLTYLEEENYNKLENLRREVGALLWNFYKSF